MTGGPEPDLGSPALSQWIAEAGAGLEAPFEFRRLGRGRSNLTFLVTDRRGRRCVLRRPPFGPLLASAHDTLRESRILECLRDTSVPAPRPLASCDDRAVADTSVLLMEFVDGVAIDEPHVAAGLAPGLRERIGPELASALATVHSVDLRATGLESLARHDHYGARQLRRWRAQWRASAGPARPEVEALAARLERALPEQSGLTLVHGDYHLLNCILDPVSGTVRGILDWELSTLGDPLADLGTLLAYWSEPGEPALDDVFGLTSAPGFARRAELERAYAAASGRDTGTAGFWQALAYWKIAIIAQGVIARSRNDPANPAPVDESSVSWLLARAEQTADTAGLP
jgi:aminoglycoside phosphotransferase (APT) family kinase protein